MISHALRRYMDGSVEMLSIAQARSILGERIEATNPNQGFSNHKLVDGSYIEVYYIPNYRNEYLVPELNTENVLVK